MKMSEGCASQNHLGRDRSISEERVEGFFRFAKEALAAEDVESFFNILMERNVVSGTPEQFSLILSPEIVLKMLAVEEEILERLENERRRIIADMDSLSRRMNMVKAYSPRFPFPAMPAFFDQTG